MSALTTPKGPLPARVYWVRRLLLLSTVFLLVFASSRLLGGDDTSETATQAGATQTQEPGQESGDEVPEGTEPDATPTGAEGEEPAAGSGKKRAKAATPEPPPPPPLPEPSGPCEPADVVVTPSVPATIGADGLTINLEFRTKVSQACTWVVSAETVTAKITSGPDHIWSSQQCPAALPTGEIVVRNVEGTVLPMVWNLRRSDASCSAQTEWARLGWYHVDTATLGGEPTSVQFELARAPQEVVTEKPAADEKAKDKKKTKKKRRQHRAGDDGGGTAEPNG